MDLARSAAALADPMRTKIMSLLANPDGAEALCCPPSPLGLCVCNIADNLKVSQPRVSYHLRILREAGFVTETPKGTWSHYRLERHVVAQFCNEILSLAGIKED